MVEMWANSMVGSAGESKTIWKDSCIKLKTTILSAFKLLAYFFDGEIERNFKIDNRPGKWPPIEI